jgi:hypothetical protein
MTGTMELSRVSEPSPVPSLYVERVEDLLGRVPLIPCFLDGNANPLFRTSMPIDNGLPLSVGALMVQALPRGKAAMFTRSTLGFGHLDAPNLALVVCLWPKINESARSPGQR